MNHRPYMDLFSVIVAFYCKGNSKEKWIEQKYVELHTARKMQNDW